MVGREAEKSWESPAIGTNVYYVLTAFQAVCWAFTPITSFNPHSTRTVLSSFQAFLLYR